MRPFMFLVPLFTLCGTAAAQQIPPASLVLPATAAGTVLGRSVFDSLGDDVGLLVDVLVNRDGKPLAAVIDVGGFLGIGTRRVAIGWNLLRFTQTGTEMRIAMDLTFQSAAAAPEYRGPDDTYVVIDRPPP